MTTACRLKKKIQQVQKNNVAQKDNVKNFINPELFIVQYNFAGDRSFLFAN